MLNVEYNYYTEVFKGQLIPNEAAFNSTVIESIAYIDNMTRGKANNLVTVPECVKNAVCAVCEVIYKTNEADTNQIVTSESVGEHSISYSNNKKTEQEREKEKMRKALIFLSRSGLLYGGLK